MRGEKQPKEAVVATGRVWRRGEQRQAVGPGDETDTKTAGRASRGHGQAVANCRLHGPAREARIGGASRQKEKPSEWQTGG